MGQSESLACANSNDAKGVLLGDANGDGLTNGTKNTLFVSLAAAQQIIAASGFVGRRPAGRGISDPI